MTEALYVRIAADLRRRIVSGDFPPGSRLPTREELSAEYKAAPGVIQQATRILIREALLLSRPGAGMFVRARPERRPLVRSWYQDRLAQQLEEQGRQGTRSYASDTMQAPPEIRERLGLGTPDGHHHDVMRTAYTFASDDEGPWMLVTSWEPLSITKGTAIAFPEAGPHAGLGIPHRMAAVDITVDSWQEEVSARPASPEEARQLGIGAGAVVVAIERAYHAGDQVVEVADIIVPAESTKLLYNGPVGER
ncbi:GntR family transcriptional regulator [Nonomuraea monospora]|uniref:GntR family transcriptional regulator n=1 Tax=Nonomuraea monospora TaxID=568818 RepID=A0ABN3C9A6_9ACTN